MSANLGKRKRQEGDDPHAHGVKHSSGVPAPHAHAHAEAKAVPKGLSALVQIRRLFFVQPELLVEERLASRVSKISALLSVYRSATPGEINAKVASEAESLISALRGSGAAASRAALRLGAVLDGAYMELFVADQSAGGGRGVPAPHEYLASVVSTPHGKPTPCGECGSMHMHLHAILLCPSCTARNPQLAYLRLRSFEAAQIDIPRLTAAALSVEGVSAGPPSGTMRSAEPLGCDTLRKWQAAVRERVCAWSSFACPDAAAAKALHAFCKGAALHEVGAGTGYWAKYLSICGLKVCATDSRPVDAPRSGRANEYHSRLKPWFKVAPADASVAAAAAGAAAGVLFLCYPPPTDMGLSAVRAFERARGSLLALVGELRGDTGSAALERLLAAGWLLERSLPLPAYGDTVACLSLWRRKAEGETRDPGPQLQQQQQQQKRQPRGPLEVAATIGGRVGQPLTVTLSAAGCEVQAPTQSTLAAAKSRPTSRAEIMKALGSLGDTPFHLATVNMAASLEQAVCSDKGEGIHIALAEVKAARRSAVEALLAALASEGRDTGVPTTTPASASASASASSSSQQQQQQQQQQPRLARAWPLACESCGQAPSTVTNAPMLRDRLTRSVIACDKTCAQDPATTVALENALKERHLPPLAVWERHSKTSSVWRPSVLL